MSSQGPIISKRLRWIREDQLPEELSNEDYDEWYIRSIISDGIRIGPNFPLPPIECVQKPCRFCGILTWVQEDDQEPACDPCDQIDIAHANYWLELEKQARELAGASES